MAVLFEQPVLIGGGFWRVDWSSTLDDPSYRVRVDGREIVETDAESITIASGSILEVLDDADLPAEPVFPPSLLLTWNTGDDHAEYRIEKYISGVWTEIVVLTLDADADWMSYDTGLIDDETTHQYRVIPIDAAGNDGTEEEFTALLVRHPDVPDVVYEYDDGTGVVTISAA